MKLQADKKRSEHSFSVSETVFLKLQPYVQSSVGNRANHKLRFKFYGPYQVIEKVRTIAYNLQLPPGSAIHVMFHVSQLKKVLTNDL
jgi:hypothetical protein